MDSFPEIGAIEKIAKQTRSQRSKDGAERWYGQIHFFWKVGRWKDGKMVRFWFLLYYKQKNFV
tara:strand:- start:470 stop:658 length:189 start_codon:yes stop_codon:yes gene_type:complete